MRNFLFKAYGFMITVLMLIITGYLFISGIFVLNEIPANTEVCIMTETKWYLLIGGIALLIVILYFLRDKINKIDSNILTGILMVYSLLICLCTICFLVSIPGADQKKVLQLAYLFHKGDYGFSLYVMKYPHQLPLIFLNEAISAVVGERNIYVWLCLNTFFICGSQFLLVKLVKNNVDKKYVNFVILIQFMNVPLCLFSTFIYGNIMGLFLALTSICLLFNGKKEITIPRIIFSSILLVAACLVRKNNSIILIAMVITIVIFMLKKDYKRLLFIPLTLILYFGSFAACERYYEVRSGIELGSGNPSSVWIAMGLSEGSIGCGWYNGFTNYKDTGVDKGDAEGLDVFSKAVISERINTFIEDPAYAVHFFNVKILSTWLTPDFQGFWDNMINNPLFKDNVFRQVLSGNGRYYRLVLFILDFFMEAVYFGCFVYFIFEFKDLIKRKEYQLNLNILSLIFLGGFLFHIFWETKAQYAVTYYALMFALSGIGWYRLVSIRDVNKESSAVVEQILQN